MTEQESSGSGPVGSIPDLSSVLDSLDEPVTVIAPDYRVMYINTAARALFNVPGAAAGEVHCYEISHRRTSPCSGDGHPCPMEDARRSRASVRVHHDHYDAGGVKRVVEIIASPLADEHGAFTGIVESQRDVTQRHAAERALRTYSEELRKSNKIKDLFIDIMRHDLLGPAGVIRNAAALGMREGEPGLQPDEVEMIYRSSRKMIDLIQNASVYAKIQESDKLTFNPAPLSEMIRLSLEELKGYAAGKKMTFSIEADPSCEVNANPLLATVFTNLLSNALKYGPDGSEVTVTVERKGEHCLVSVADRGEGIPDEDKEEIFARFSRMDKRGVKGSGLGLAIVERIVDLHGGRSWVEDNPGGGSVFRVELKAH